MTTRQVRPIYLPYKLLHAHFKQWFMILLLCTPRVCYSHFTTLVNHVPSGVLNVPLRTRLDYSVHEWCLYHLLSWNLVPEYEITHPFLSNEKGEFISYQLSNPHPRHRRNTDEGSVFYYHLKAFGIGLHLNLTLNENLLGPKFAIETRHNNRTTTITNPSAADHFIGNVISHQGSTVAMSYGLGLVRHSYIFSNFVKQE